ncbi:MAG: hypothetical protein EPO28_14475 [Saprospiraceae bacterium]|nr:MAG: hypothetical protein EPO28_14475 [Saprospiraceae bacterium]
MQKILPFLLFAVPVFFLPSCFSPRPLVKVDAGEQEVFKWSYGKKVIQLSGDSMSANIFFDTYTKKYLVFDVEITNWGTQDVLVSPENFYMSFNGKDANAMALDPETEIFNRQVKRSKDEAAAKNGAVALGAIVVAAVVASAVSDDDNGGSSDSGSDYSVTNITYVNDVPPPVVMSALPPELEFWENYSLRKTTLSQGYKVGGKVVFRRHDDYPSFNIFLPVDNETLSARFEQRIIKP